MMFKPTELVINKNTGRTMLVIEQEGSQVFCSYVSGNKYVTGMFHSSELGSLVEHMNRYFDKQAEKKAEAINKQRLEEKIERLARQKEKKETENQ
jgi:hypothetical protein